MGAKMELGWYVGIALVINTALSALVAYAAQQRGRMAINFFFLSFLTSFLVGILVLLALPPIGVDRQIQRENCPQCDELISLKASICPHCKSEVRAAFAANQLAREQEEALAAEILEAEVSRRNAAQSAERVSVAEARRHLRKRILTNPVSWIAAAAAIGLAVFFFVATEQNERLAAEEETRIENLVRPDCSIPANSVNFEFDDSVTVKVSLPTSCSEGLRQALEEGLISEATDLGQINLMFSLDGVKARDASIELTDDFSEDYEFRIPNSVFYEFASNRRMAAKSVQAEVNYESQLQTGEVTAVESDIPLRAPSIAADLMLLSSGFEMKVATVKYTSYQVADAVDFDWPLDSQDRKVRGYEFYKFDTSKESATILGLVGTLAWYLDTPPEQLEQTSLRITATAGSSEAAVLDFPVSD
jgi:RNA polymerase subunit RPABC4/transcription elongation factor Spt4